jgi:hypothetical protein
VVDYTQQMALLVGHKYRMDFMSLHDSLYFGYLCRGQNHLRLSRHDVADGVIEELCLPALHCTAYVAIGNEADDAPVFH